MRRKPGHLLDLERAICREAHEFDDEFYGYQIAKRLKDDTDSLLIAQGTLYRALSRLEEMGLVKSRWEDARIAARENRPGRRLYSLTSLGHAVAIDKTVAVPRAPIKRGRRRWAPA